MTDLFPDQMSHNATKPSCSFLGPHEAVFQGNICSFSFANYIVVDKNMPHGNIEFLELFSIASGDVFL